MSLEHPEFAGSDEKLGRFTDTSRDIVVRFRTIGELTSENLNKFSIAFQFSEHENRFYDARPFVEEGERHDTLDNFRKLLREKTTKSSETVRETYKIYPKAPNTRCSNMSFCLNGAGTQVGAVAQPELFLEFDCSKIAFNKFECGFKSVKFQIEFQNSDALIANDRLDEANVNGASLRQGGTAFSPYWKLHASEGVLEGTFYPKEPLFKIGCAQDGDRVLASMSVSRILSELQAIDGEEIPTATKKQLIKRMIIEDQEKQQGESDQQIESEWIIATQLIEVNSG